MKSDIQPLRLLAKALLLFVAVNLAFALFNPPIYRVSLYNNLFPGRVRLPFADDLGIYSVMVDNLDIMLASHEIAAAKRAEEFRVAILGDSSVWGEGAAARDSISVLWNEYGYSCGNKSFRFYNLAYPHPSVIKDLIILDKAMEYEPDMIVWFITLNTLTPRRLGPFIRANAARAERVLEEHDVTYNLKDTATSNTLTTFYEKTLVGRRSELARMIKLQALGLIWTISSADRTAASTDPADLSMDVPNDRKYKGLESESKLGKEMMTGALVAGHEIAQPIPVLIVNEPMFIATGRNSNVRYNEGYPRWAYDYYRQAMMIESQRNQWHYLDLWDSIAPRYFADTVLHISPEGQRLLIQQINPVLQSIVCNPDP